MKSSSHSRIDSQWLSIGVCLAFLYGCGGGGSSPTSVVNPSESVGGGGVVTLTWTPPTTNVDGTGLNDLAGYRIYYGTASGAYSNMIDLTTPGLTSYVIENLPLDTYYFVVTAYDYNNNESAYSNEVTKTLH